jgi:hypothetical protein
MNNGCFAAYGPLALQWDKVDNGESGFEWDEFCARVAALPDAQLWRHNQGGDLPSDGRLIDADALSALVSANAGKRGFTYTHHDALIASNRDAIADANARGFTVNLSGNTLAHADELAAFDIGPVVVVLDADLGRAVKGKEWAETEAEYKARVDLKAIETPDGRAVVVCPATYKDTDCAHCQLCQRQRASIVGFPAHGAAKRKASNIAKGN